MEAIRFETNKKRTYYSLIERVQFIEKYCRKYSEKAEAIEKKLWEILLKAENADEIENIYVETYVKLLQGRITTAGKLRIIKQMIKTIEAK